MEEKELTAFEQHHRTYTKINTLYKRYTEGPLKIRLLLVIFHVLNLNTFIIVFGMQKKK